MAIKDELRRFTSPGRQYQQEAVDALAEIERLEVENSIADAQIDGLTKDIAELEVENKRLRSDSTIPQDWIEAYIADAKQVSLEGDEFIDIRRAASDRAEHVAIMLKHFRERDE